MALLKSHQTCYGIEFEYNKIHVTGEHQNFINFDVNLYYNQNARESGANPYEYVKSFIFEHPDIDIDLRTLTDLQKLELCYNYLKTLPDYEGAIDI